MAANLPSNNASAQRARLLDRLQHGTVSTLDARADLDVLHPAARVMELRRKGYHIETVRSLEYSLCGQLHRVARYLLIPSGDGLSLPLRMSPQSGGRASP